MQEVNLSKYIILASSKDEKDYLHDNPCDCSNNPWSLKEKTVVHVQDGREYFIRKGFCNICGSSIEFFFNVPLEVEIIEEDGNPRFVHYFIAHRVLPESFFDDPEGFLFVLKGATGNNRLKALWGELNEDAREQGDEIIPPDGLLVEKVNIKNREGIIISMPEPRFTAEAAFIVCLEPDSATAHRYFVYEYTFPDKNNEDNQAVLCEWLPGKRRRNFERHGAVTKEACIELVAEQLDNEETRTKAGARSVNAPTWDMVEEEDVAEVLHNNEAYRHHICLFAYYIAPSVFCDEKLDFSNFDELQEVLQDSWDELGLMCEEKGYTYISPEDISFKMYEYRSEEIFFLTFPAPLSLPEPYFLAVKPNDRQTIYYCEKSSSTKNTALLTKIEGGRHGIQGGIELPEDGAFLDAIYGEYSKDAGPNLMSHLTSYANIDAVFRSIFKKNTDNG